VSYTTASCPLPAATVSPFSRTPSQILITRALVPPSCFTRKLVSGHSTTTSATARPGKLQGVSCKPSHLQTLGHLHHSPGNLPPLTNCSPKALHRTAHVSLFACKDHHQRSQPFQCTVQHLVMNPAQAGGWLGTRLCFLRQLPYPEELRSMWWLATTKMGKCLCTLLPHPPLSYQHGSSTFWSQFSLLKNQTQFTFAGLVIFRLSEL